MTLPRVAECMRQLVASKRLPTACCIVYDGCTTSMVHAYCATAVHRDIVHQKMWLSSLTKPVVSLAVLILHDQRKLQLSDLVSKYLCDFSGSMVTIEHLLLHVSGLDFSLSSMLPNGQSAFAHHRLGMAKDDGLAATVRRLSKQPGQSKPGKFQYGAGHDLLCAIVEVVTGSSIGVALRALLFNPLRMDHTCFLVDDAACEKVSNAPLYTRDGDGVLYALPEYGVFYDRPRGYGNLFSTPADFAKLCICIANAGQTPDGHRIVSQQTFDTCVLTDRLAAFDTTTRVHTLPGVFYDRMSCFGALTVDPQADTLPAGKYSPKGCVSWGGANSLLFMADPQTRKAFLFVGNTVGVCQDFRLEVGKAVVCDLYC